MRYHLIAVGRARGGPEKMLFDQYVKRLSQPLKLHEVEDRKSLSGQQLKIAEGNKILATIPDGAVVVALDENGRTFTSPEIAKKIEHWRDDGIRDLAFVIGGADGLHESVKKRADVLLSFGAMTWPHMLVRAMVAEQIYRSQTILAGHPYHRK